MCSYSSAGSEDMCCAKLFSYLPAVYQVTDSSTRYASIKPGLVVRPWTPWVCNWDTTSSFSNRLSSHINSLGNGRDIDIMDMGVGLVNDNQRDSCVMHFHVMHFHQTIVLDPIDNHRYGSECVC